MWLDLFSITSYTLTRKWHVHTDTQRTGSAYLLHVTLSRSGSRQWPKFCCCCILLAEMIWAIPWHLLFANGKTTDSQYISLSDCRIGKSTCLSLLWHVFDLPWQSSKTVDLSMICSTKALGKAAPGWLKKQTTDWQTDNPPLKNRFDEREPITDNSTASKSF